MCTAGLGSELGADSFVVVFVVQHACDPVLTYMCCLFKSITSLFVSFFRVYMRILGTVRHGLVSVQGVGPPAATTSGVFAARGRGRGWAHAGASLRLLRLSPLPLLDTSILAAELSPTLLYYKLARAPLRSPHTPLHSPPCALCSPPRPYAPSITPQPLHALQLEQPPAPPGIGHPSDAHPRPLSHATTTTIAAPER